MRTQLALVTLGLAPLIVVALTCDQRNSSVPTGQDEPALSARPPEESQANTPEPVPPPASVDDMVRIPPGQFWFGCNEALDSQCGRNEPPGRLVYLDQYFIDRTEVTVEAYAECVTAGACTQPRPSSDFRCDTDDRNWGQPGRERHPVNCVDWEQANRYCAFRGKRLPTPEQWEKAARGTDGRIYPWGNGAPSPGLAVMRPDRGDWRGTEEVGSHSAGASPYGALDMAGNVAEWTAPSSPLPVYPGLPNYYGLRGGHWGSHASGLRTSSRLGQPEDSVVIVAGFRCVYVPLGR